MAGIGESHESKSVTILIGTAGWSLPSKVAERFPTEGTSLQRYASKFGAVEINSSFHRPHRISTWERWYESVPDQFRFSVKVPKQITHANKLVECGSELDRFIEQASALKEKLAVILVQLPPKLSFDSVIAGDFLRDLGARTNATIACEPRHAGWFTEEADKLLSDLSVARVAADPAICEEASRPGGWPGLRYWRLHGSPITYRSSYHDRIGRYARTFEQVDEHDTDVWCMFDNTASSAATSDALALLDELAVAGKS